MNDAEAEKDYHKYFIYFKMVFQRMLPFMTTEERQACQRDWEKLRELEKEIDDSKHLADQTKAKMKLELRKTFADTHTAYIFLAFPRARLTIVRSDANIDFGKMEFRKLKRIVRATGVGAPSAIKEGVDS